MFLLENCIMKRKKNTRNVCLKTILISSISLSLISHICAQTETQRQQIRAASNTSVLQQLAIQFDSIYSIQKAEAEQWALVISKKIRL